MKKNRKSKDFLIVLTILSPFLLAILSGILFNDPSIGAVTGLGLWVLGSFVAVQ